MARTAEHQRVPTIQVVSASLKRKAGVLRVVDCHGKRDVNTANLVNDGDERVKVNLRIVRDRYARELLNNLYHVAGAAERICGVDLRLAVVAHVHVGVSRDGDERDLDVLRVDASEDDGVGAVVPVLLAFFLDALLTLVDAQEQHVERVARLVALRKDSEQVLVSACGKALVDAVDVGPRHGAESKQTHEHHNENASQDRSAGAPAANT